MKIVLTHHNALTIKRARHVCRQASMRMSLTLRNGNIYTMRYNPGVQPRTASQQSSWSLFKEANRLVTADFHNPSRRAFWLEKHKSQSRYKTARGLARAYYIGVLKSRMLKEEACKSQASLSSSSLASLSIRPLANLLASRRKSTHHVPTTRPPHHPQLRTFHSLRRQGNLFPTQT